MAGMNAIVIQINIEKKIFITNSAIVKMAIGIFSDRNNAKHVLMDIMNKAMMIVLHAIIGFYFLLY